MSKVTEAPRRGPVVHVVDDDRSFLRAVSRLLEAAGFDVEPFDSAEAFLRRDRHHPGCVILDLRLGGETGLDVQGALSASPDPLPVIFLSGHGDVQSSVRAMKGGAVDFLTKPVHGHELVQAVNRALAADAKARQEQEALNHLRRQYETLTGREREVFARVAAGLLNKEVAAELGITERTVKAHRSRVMQKLRLDSVAALARAADRLKR